MEGEMTESELNGTPGEASYSQSSVRNGAGVNKSIETL